jgi:hypothetical protein
VVSVQVPETVGLEKGDVILVVQFDDRLLPTFCVSETRLVPAGLALPLLGSHGHNANIK